MPDARNSDEKKPEETARHRLQFDFTPEAYRRLQQIRQLAEAQSHAEVVRDALRLYEWFLARVGEGWTIVLKKGEREREIVLFGSHALTQEPVPSSPADL